MGTKKRGLIIQFLRYTFILFSYREEDEELTDDDDCDEEMNAAHILPHAENSKQGLEWDDSTLNTTANGSKTYCV